MPFRRCSGPAAIAPFAGCDDDGVAVADPLVGLVEPIAFGDVVRNIGPSSAVAVPITQQPLLGDVTQSSQRHLAIIQVGLTKISMPCAYRA